MDQHPPLTSRLVTASHCGHLRHKGMYARGDSAPDDPLYRDPIEATSYWCVCTQKPFGPDGLPVGPEACGHGRGCCDH
jgi:hypothetical protein